MQIEVTKKAGRKPRWKLRDVETGRYFPLRLGRVHLPPTIEENRRVRDAVDRVLTTMATEQARQRAEG